MGLNFVPGSPRRLDASTAEAIARAEHDVWLCTYILAQDASAQVILDVMLKIESPVMRVSLSRCKREMCPEVCPGV